MNNGTDGRHLLAVDTDEIRELRKIAEALFFEAKTKRDERMAVLLMKILGAGAQQSVSAREPQEQ